MESRESSLDLGIVQVSQVGRIEEIKQSSDSEIPLVLGLLQCQKHVIHGNGSSFLLLALAVGVGVGVGVGIQIRTPLALVLVLVLVLSVSSCGSGFVLLGVVGLGFEEGFVLVLV